MIVDQWCVLKVETNSFGNDRINDVNKVKVD